MRESQRPVAEQEAISRAMTLLAIATRDTTIDAGVKRVYIPHLDDYTVEEIELACELLFTADWFPKLGELLKACSRARRKYQDARMAEVAAAAPRHYIGPPDEERKAEWLAKLKATAYKHRMPHAEVPDDGE